VRFTEKQNIIEKIPGKELIVDARANELENDGSAIIRVDCSISDSVWNATVSGCFAGGWIHIIKK